MRVHRALVLVVGLAVASCDDTGGPTPDGRLVVSTSTVGEAADADGYRVTVDDLDTLVLTPSGTAELAVRAGAHTLRLLGVPEHCSVLPAASLEVEVESGARTPVDFAIDCAATGVRVTTTTTGLDIDADGYRITVDGEDRAGVLASGTTLVQAGPGERTIALTGLTGYCAVEGAATHTVTVTDKAVVPLAFAVVCTAATGVIGVVVGATGEDIDGDYTAMVGMTSYGVRLGGPWYLTNVVPGNRVVTLVAPANCAVETEPQSVLITGGTLVRDTAVVSFAVSCMPRLPTLRITASTSGTPSPYDYSVHACVTGDFYCEFYGYPLGQLPPNGTLITQIPPGSYDIRLEGIPVTCSLVGPSSFSIAQGDTLDLAYSVTCP